MSESIIIKAKLNCRKCNGVGYFTKLTGDEFKEKEAMFCDCMVKQMNKILINTDNNKQFKSEIKMDTDGIKKMFSTLETV